MNEATSWAYRQLRVTTDYAAPSIASLIMLEHTLRDSKRTLAVGHLAVKDCSA
jgi:hypothetical protein